MVGDEHDDGTFDEAAAASYDQDVADRFRPEVLGPTVEVLADLAAGGRALELAIGTGRVALPLTERGVPVEGIELSRAMVAKLREKRGGDAVPVRIGDMATTAVPGDFALVYLVFSTLSNLLTQEAQVDCFANAARHLAPGGRFVVEAGLPRLRLLPPGQRFVAFDASPTHVGVDEYDVANQLLTSHHRSTHPDGIHAFTSQHRWAYPAELDLMARLAGLHLEHRWSGWDRSPYTSESTSHVSVWRLPG
jgi:SAM-dependent methyltransferase